MLKYIFYLTLQCTFITIFVSRAAQETTKQFTRPDQVQLFTTLFTQNDEYARDFTRRLNKVIGILHDLVDSNLNRQVHACLSFPFQVLEEPYKQTLNNLINELIPLYYTQEGMLKTFVPDNISKRNFCIAQFLKTDLDYSNYMRLLRMFNFYDVIAYEENTSSYIWNNLYNFASGEWLNLFYEYPDNMQERIQNNHGNKVLARLHTLCAHNEYAHAYALISHEELPLCTQFLNECYTTFKNKYCDENGLIKKY